MGNFDPLFAEIRRRRYNRWVLGLLGLNWTILFAALCIPLALRA
jgi:hypothetical protein